MTSKSSKVEQLFCDRRVSVGISRFVNVLREQLGVSRIVDDGLQMIRNFEGLGIPFEGVDPSEDCFVKMQFACPLPANEQGNCNRPLQDFTFRCKISDGCVLLIATRWHCSLQNQR